MKKQLLTVLLSAAAVIGGNINANAQSTLIYNWDFNGGAADSAGRGPSYHVAGSGSASYFFWGNYIDFATGSAVNVRTGDYAGNSIRFRNPADSVVFWMPTTGYKNVQFSYVEQRTNSGSTHNTVYYTIDGTHFLPASNAGSSNATTYTVDSFSTISDSTATGIGWELRTYSFTGDTMTKDNAHFGVAILFVEGPDSTSGNNRFDNVTLKGDPTGTLPSAVATVTNPAVTYALFPNPVTNTLAINSNIASQKSFAVYNTTGEKVAEGTSAEAHFTINTSRFATGVYFLNISENATGAVSTIKFTKQ